MTVVPMSVPKSYIRAVIQFLTPENVHGHKIQCCLCAAYKKLNIVMKSTLHTNNAECRVWELFLLWETESRHVCQIWGLTLVPLPWFFIHTVWNNELFFTKLDIHANYTFTKNMHTNTLLQWYHSTCTKQPHKIFWTLLVYSSKRISVFSRNSSKTFLTFFQRFPRIISLTFL